MRKLVLLIVAALAVTGAMASSASAAVEVRNAEDQSCDEVLCEVGIEGRFDPGQDVGGYPVALGSCRVTATLQVSGSGSFVLSNWDFEWPGTACNTEYRPYQGTPWGGQVAAPGDDDYRGSSDFSGLFVMTVEGANHGINGIPFEVYFNIDSDVWGDQDWSIERQYPFSSGATWFWVSGGSDGGAYTLSEELQISQVEE